MEKTNSPGALVIIGGAEDREGECRILREFLTLCGGTSARIVIIAVASEEPDLVGSRYVGLFRQLGANEIEQLNIVDREDANKDEAVQSITKANGVFFTGGNQLRITRLLGGTKIDTAIHKQHENGLVLAGTSAGAAMMSTIMIVGGLSQTSLRAGIVDLGPGMEFISGVLIDQHFEERGRLRRLMSAIAQYPRDLGVGIDEDTAIIVRDHMFEVIGEGSVTVIDAGALTHSNLTTASKNELLAICGVKIHILPAGYRFDLQNRLPLLPETVKGKRKINRAETAS